MAVPRWEEVIPLLKEGYLGRVSEGIDVPTY
jgi:hypothetical protein